MPPPPETSRRARREAARTGAHRAHGALGAGAAHARTTGRTTRAGHLARRFPGAALALAGVLALGGGVATAAALVGPPSLTTVTPTAADVTRTAEPTVGPRTSRGTSADGVEATADRVPLPAEALAATEPLVLPAPPATAATVDPNAVDAAGLTLADRDAGLLSTAVPTAAGGDVVVVPGVEAAPAPERPVRTVRVEVEAGLEVDGALFARTVMVTLNDPRGWGADGSVSFARTDGPADLVVVLASPDLVDDLCAPLDTVGRYSCGTNGRAVLNHLRWVQGGKDFPDRTLYRQYLVNHEVGHLLGNRHVECPGPGRLAPLMQQQTETTGACVANGWPFPG
ncbi:DUF3152 domain-containing protein [Actinotalea solisilvae]|uniref:DUF3152 domain-containing protein n=1 Tax=Actinotalea solisilvae TaxID=2072922 RepID=UPI0018F18306|nr:DUF3152 domain-containing protein [Actinotalea solisilvae]